MSWFAVSEVDIENDPRTNYNTPVEDDNFKQSFVQLQYTRELSRKSLLTSTIYYNRLDGEWDLDLGNFGAGPDVLNYQLASNFYGIMTNYKYTGSKLRLNIGAHANMYDREHGMAILPLTTERLYTNTGYKNEMSGFLKAGYDIGKLTLFGDAQLRHATFRYDGDVAMDNLEWTFFNPKAGLVYNMCKHWRFYGSVGQSHREPTRNDMFMGEDNLVEYTEVTPEEVVDYELGFGYQGKKFKVKTNGYYMDFKNEITLIGALGSNGLPLMTNVENSFRLGSETEISYQIVKTLKIYNNTNVSYNRITDGGQEFQPLYTPPVVSNTGLMFEYKNFFVGMSAKYHSESFIDFANENVTPSFVLLNADMGVTYNKFTLTGKLVNITNERYFTNGYSDGTQNYFFVNAPLSGYVTLKMSL
jgi:iron complex outermembrane receptor protein